jgi:hypothetical protein
MKLDKVVAPNLPLASASWTQRFQEQFSNVLRLFFNRVVGTLNELLGEDGGRFISMPHATFYDTTDQYALAANTPYAVAFDSEYLTNSVYKDRTDPTRIYVTHAGIYNFAFSLQLAQTSSSTHFFYVWFRRNGVDAPFSASQYVINGNPAEAIAALNFFVEMQPGDYFQLMWMVSDTRVYIANLALPSPAPQSPSAILTVNFVSESSKVTEVAP